MRRGFFLDTAAFFRAVAALPAPFFFAAFFAGAFFFASFFLASFFFGAAFLGLACFFLGFFLVAIGAVYHRQGGIPAWGQPPSAVRPSQARLVRLCKKQKLVELRVTRQRGRLSLRVARGDGAD